MRNIAKKTTLTALSLSVLSLSAYAQQISYNLEFSGDTISKSLIRNNKIKDKNDLAEIKRILDLNNLDWESAKRLPVGQLYYVQKAMKEQSQELAAIDNADGEKQPEVQSKKSFTRSSFGKNKISVELGTFHHTQKLEKSNIYSDMSQYLNVSYTNKQKYQLSAGVKRYSYTSDEDQNISKDNTQYKHELSASKIFQTKYLDITPGIYTKGILTFNTDELNEVNFEDATTSGAHLTLSKNVYTQKSFSIGLGLNIQKNITATNLDDYLHTGFNTSLNLKNLGRPVSIIAKYDSTSISVDSEDVDEKIASIGLATVF